RRALTTLDDPAVPFVIGDATDGGFWLFGGRVALPREVWTGVHYSHAQTASELRQQLMPFGAVGNAGHLTDVDDVRDLPALRDALDGLSESGSAQQALRQWLDTVVMPTC
ncbi:MAG: hypothetical protein ABI379_10745, partial [Rhodanobacter sp.]